MALAVFLIPIVIIVGIVLVSSAGDIFDDLKLSAPNIFSKLQVPRGPQAPQHRQVSEATQTFLQPSEAGTPPNTIITSGPPEGTIFFFTSTATFGFKAIVPPNTEGIPTYETKIDVYDDNWIPTSDIQRTVTLPSGPQEYTFSVRALLDGTPDPTPVMRTFRINTSPHAGKVEISKITAPTSTRNSVISLRTRIAQDETINITGWKLEGQIDNYILPQGIEEFSRLDLPSLQRTDIILQRGTAVTISTDFNPLANNVNFQPNQCFGYFAADRGFPIRVTRSCPDVRPSREQVSSFAPACQDFILKRLRGCVMPEYSQIREIVTDFDCFTYLKAFEDRFEYEYCYQQHSEDKNFTSNAWHIYADGQEFLRPVHDRVFLYDENGLYVDDYLY